MQIITGSSIIIVNLFI